MDAHESAELPLTDAATSTALAERGRGLLELLRCHLRLRGACPALPDPPGPDHRTVSGTGPAAPVVDCSAGPLTACRIEVTGADRIRPVQVPRTWAGRPLVPGSGDRWPCAGSARRGPVRVAPLLAPGIDPVRSLRTAALLVTGAFAGVALGADDACHDMPDLPGHEVLTPGSGALLAARARIGGRRICGSFLWPVGGPHAHGDHVQVTALVAPVNTRPGLVGLVLVSPPPDLHGLTPRELEVLGLLVEGAPTPRSRAPS